MCSFGLLAINWNQKINGLNSCSLHSWCICRAEPGIVSDQSIQSETITRSWPETFSWCFGVFRVDLSKITPLWGPGGQHGGAGKGTPGTHSGEKAKAGTLFRSHVYGRAWQRCLGCLFQVAQCVAGGLGGSRFPCQRTRVPSCFAPSGNHSGKIVGVLKGWFLKVGGRVRSCRRPGNVDVRRARGD